MSDNDIFLDVIQRQLLIPKWMKDSIDLALTNGTSIFSSTQLYQYLNQNLEQLFTVDLYSSEYSLNSDDINRIHSISSLGESLLHSSLRLNYGWGMPCEESISTISSYLKSNLKSSLIEVGAGSGLWSALLQARNANTIIPCELNLRADTPLPTFCNVLNVDANNLLLENPHSNVLIVWPDTHTDIHLLLDKISPQSFLFLVGPPEVTGNLSFYKSLDESFTLHGNITSSNFSSNENLFILQKEKPIINHHFFEKFIQSQKPVFKLKKLKN